MTRDAVSQQCRRAIQQARKARGLCSLVNRRRWNFSPLVVVFSPGVVFLRERALSFGKLHEEGVKSVTKIETCAAGCAAEQASHLDVQGSFTPREGGSDGASQPTSP